MLADAFAAERFRLLRDRGALFWGVIFAPLASLFLVIGVEMFVRRMIGKTPVVPVDMAGRVIKSLADAGSPFAGVFVLILAAGVVAGDYRWETWRLLTPRNGRANLLLAKMGTVAMMTAVVMGLYAVAGTLEAVFSATTSGSPFVAHPGGSTLAHLAGTFAISWLQLMVLAGLAAVVGVATRSTMGALVVGLVFAFAQSLVANWMHEPTLKALALPAFSGGLLKTVLLTPHSVTDDPAPWGLALAFLLAWAIGLPAAALALFQRQDLTRE